MKFIQFTDLLDIFVIAFLIYAALIWFRRTSARFVIIGISILGVVYILARYLNLYLTTAIFQAFFAVFFIAVVIIFQEELRHFFEKVALWGTWRGRRKLGPKHAIVEVIVRTVANLSQKRVGALIVFRGEDPLDRHLEGGADLQGEPSEQLLESIFDPHSAGHDGAVIINNNILELFGTYLPLSKDLRQISQFGTRHTAALGLVERCDALCVVVSEERGSIAIAREGKIHSQISITQLNNILDKFYDENFPLHKAKVGTSWLSSNLKEKVFAILLACSIWWVFGQRTETIRRDFVIPVEYRSLSPMLILEEPKQKEALLTLSGLERAFDMLEPRSLKVSLDMSEAQPGERSFVVTRQDVRFPANLNLERIEPSILPINISELISLDISVQVKTTGSVKPPVRIKKISVKPKKVRVIATPNIKGSELKIYTEAIDLTQITETTTLTPRLVVPTDIRFMNGKAPLVKVTLEVTQEEEKAPSQKLEEEKKLKENVIMSPFNPEPKIRKNREKYFQ